MIKEVKKNSSYISYGNQEDVPFGREIFRRSKPYYARNEKRSVCMCIYHLRCEEFVQFFFFKLDAFSVKCV